MSINQNYRKIPIPYLKHIPITKLYTLILDLDETLIHFIPQGTGNKGIIQFRPGLFQFLDNLVDYLTEFLYYFQRYSNLKSIFGFEDLNSKLIIYFLLILIYLFLTLNYLYYYQILLY